MNEIFKKREVQKSYLCLVEGHVKDSGGNILSYLRKDGDKNKSYSKEWAAEGYKEARLTYEVLQHLDHYSLLKVLPETGRHHQIRVQLSSMGHVIKGDLKYGAKRSNDDGSICLHASGLEFIHPVKKEKITIEAPLPESDAWPHKALNI